MPINKFGLSHSSEQIEEFVTRKELSNYVSQDQLQSHFCQILAFLVKEKLITINKETFETKWKFSIDDCYTQIVKQLRKKFKENRETQFNVKLLNDE